MHLSVRERRLGGWLVVAGVLFQAVWLGRPAALLSVALVIAYIVWIAEAWSDTGRALQTTYAVALGVFIVHACEEFFAGFQLQLPALVGARWSDAQFVLFNGAWLAMFVLAGWGLRRGRPVAVLIALFLAIGGGVANGLGHLVLVAVRGGYFPGAWTAPFCLIVGIALLRQLFPARA